MEKLQKRILFILRENIKTSSLERDINKNYMIDVNVSGSNFRPVMRIDLSNATTEVRVTFLSFNVIFTEPDIIKEIFGLCVDRINSYKLERQEKKDNRILDELSDSFEDQYISTNNLKFDNNFSDDVNKIIKNIELNIQLDGKKLQEYIIKDINPVK